MPTPIEVLTRGPLIWDARWPEFIFVKPYTPSWLDKIHRLIYLLIIFFKGVLTR